MTTPAAFLLLAAVAASPDPPASLDLSVGAFEVGRPEHRAAELGVKYRGRSRLRRPHPLAGAMVNGDGAVHLYLGAGVEVPLGERPFLRGSFAPGYYDPGRHGKDLGCALEFRSSVEIGWRLDGGWGLGIEAYHLSNANLRKHNPGAASLLLTLTVPLGR